MKREGQRESRQGPARLRRKGEFREVYGSARSVADRRLVLYFRPNGRGESRVGFAVGRAVGKAVVRNRVRRRLKEIVRLQGSRLPVGWDWIVVARRSAAAATFRQLEESLLGLVARLGGAEGTGAAPAPGKTGGKHGGEGENS